MAQRSDDERHEVRADFDEAVNMTPKEQEDWLGTEDSRAVGDDADGSGESTGHTMGRRIVAMKAKAVADLAEDDHDAMAKVTGYVRRHLAQGGPKADKQTSRWRYSLMNWGHDPMKG